jgi:hypothetical protein
MKLRVAWGSVGLLVASLGLAQPAPSPAPGGAAPPAPNPAPGPVPAPAPASPPAGAANTTPKADAAKAAADAKKASAAKKKDAPPPKIEGLALNRPNGGYLGLQVLSNNFVLTFYNEKKTKVAPDVVRATVRWPVKYQPAPERTVLNPNGGFALTSAYNVKPPINFKVYISLFVEGSDQAVESYVVDYHGE